MAGQRLVYGIGPVEELVSRRAREIIVLYVNPARQARERAGDAVATIAAEARRRGVTVETRTRDELDAMLASERSDAGRPPAHQGVVAVVGAFSYAALEDLIANAPAPALIVALDSVQDPHNLGAIVRSAYVLGAHGVIIPEHRAAAITPVVTKASAGATELLPIAQVKNVVRALEELKEAGVWTCAVAAVPGARPIAELDLTGPMALVLGAEGEGVRPLVAKTCDLHALIPMAAAGVGSLNVSVAAGVALYEVARQRSLKP
jgi:23S rRNA (guanosine2251-2'-O)-methyltransferase